MSYGEQYAFEEEVKLVHLLLNQELEEITQKFLKSEDASFSAFENLKKDMSKVVASVKCTPKVKKHFENLFNEYIDYLLNDSKDGFI